MITFINYLFDFLSSVFELQFVGGITIMTILFYNLILITFWIGFTRRS